MSSVGIIGKLNLKSNDYMKKEIEQTKQKIRSLGKQWNVYEFSKN